MHYNSAEVVNTRNKTNIVKYSSIPHIEVKNTSVNNCVLPKMKITTLIWALGFLVNPSATLTNLNEKGHKSTVGKKFYIFIVSNNYCGQPPLVITSKHFS